MLRSRVHDSTTHRYPRRRLTGVRRVGVQRHRRRIADRSIRSVRIVRRVGHDQRALQHLRLAQAVHHGGRQRLDGDERAPRRQAAQRQRNGQGGKAHQCPHVAADTGAVDQHGAQRHPVEIEGGKLSLKLVNVLWVDETVSARAKVREREPEGTRTRVHCDVWVEKADGTRVALGSGSALE